MAIPRRPAGGIPKTPRGSVPRDKQVNNDVAGMDDLDDIIGDYENRVAQEQPQSRPKRPETPRQAADAPTPPRARRTPARDAESTSGRSKRGNAAPDRSVEDDEDDEFAIDPNTGVRYRKMPKSEYDAEGKPVLQVRMDPDDLNKYADEFLGHLRVPMNKKQQEALRKRRVAIREKNKAEYDAYQNKIKSKYGPDDEYLEDE
jgi:hypothetical protein